MVKVSSVGIIDLDATLAANSDSRVPSQAAIKAYADYRTNRIYVPSMMTDSAGLLKTVKLFAGMIYFDIGADNDIYTFYLDKRGTESTIDFSYNKNSFTGIFDLYINGTLDSSGYDTYAPSSTNITTSISLTQPLNAGINEVKLVTNGKNASSTGYRIHIYGMWLR